MENPPNHPMVINDHDQTIGKTFTTSIVYYGHSKRTSLFFALNHEDCRGESIPSPSLKTHCATAITNTA